MKGAVEQLWEFVHSSFAWVQDSAEGPWLLCLAPPQTVAVPAAQGMRFVWGTLLQCHLLVCAPDPSWGPRSAWCPKSCTVPILPCQSPAAVYSQTHMMSTPRTRHPAPVKCRGSEEALHRQLPLADRATMVPLLYSVLDFQASPDTYERYDRMSARELFQR